ncbi:hypothetical protein M8332_03910 [Fructilactobacillus ixorae]|uniref:Uncharacterized protein n=1 Tax=Fructilactobacillus ixorae TaxID=1750535 RepID=A0ABY5C2X3_9LACO|nr:hypothetical protein [Fructilactobacillus ixorae]USS92786.1 hypothetical protein M8332_03910 [Fructilactobacillus ixorae]
MNKQWLRHQANQLIQQIGREFHPQHGMRYLLVIVRDPYAQRFNWFLNVQHPHQNQRSHPIGVVPTLDLPTLEAVQYLVRRRYQFTVVYRNFNQLRWPTTGQLISRSRR